MGVPAAEGGRGCDDQCRPAGGIHLPEQKIHLLSDIVTVSQGDLLLTLWMGLFCQANQDQKCPSIPEIFSPLVNVG